MSLESATVSFVVQKLGDLLVQEANLLLGVKDQVKSLQRELTWMQSYLKDVDEEHEEGNETLRTRIREIRRITFEAEDVVDLFILTSGARRKENILKRYACCFNFLLHTHQVGTMIEEIKTRIQESTQMLQRYQVGGRTERVQMRRLQSFPHISDDYVVGLEEDIKKLVEQLTMENNGAYILCIVGMGGSGKTTLARKLYNHQIIKQHFHSQAWVSISQEWDTHHILGEILRQASSQKKKTEEISSIEELVEEVQVYLKQIPYLIVLDDVWKKEALEDLFQAFPFQSKGSKIIITTRIHEVVRFPGLSCIFHEPRRLTKGESWDLFSKIAWNQRQSTDSYLCNDNFKKLGMEILKKCDGLPLAIIALGGVLGVMDTVEEWERVSKAIHAKVIVGRGTYMYSTVKNMIALSYQELHYDLRQCFLYFSIFPKDFNIPVGILTRMWISEGFVMPQQLCGEETLEDLAMRFLDELIQRCIIQVTRRNYEGKVKEVRIHDLMRDFVIKKAKERDFLDILSSGSSVAPSQIESRQISDHSCFSMCSQFRTENSHVRSLMVLDKSSVGPNRDRISSLEHVHKNRDRISSLEHVHKNFRLLRVLLIWGVTTSDGTLPTEIGNLIHLRYVGFRWTNITVFPESIGQLKNLLTFECSHIIQHPNRETSTPNVLWKMEQLRHLMLPSGNVPEKGFMFHTLQHLQTLRGVGGGNWMLKEMSILSPTVKRLGINGMLSREQLDAVFQCPSVVSGHLHSLSLNWYCGEFCLEQQNLEVLCRCHHLHKLELVGRIREGMPSSIQFPSNLMKLELWHTYLVSQETMTTLGKLSNLRYFKLLTDAYIGTEWVCKEGEFPQLEYLQLFVLPNLEDWIVETGAMPRLSHIEIYNCRTLKRLPEGLQHISSLKELVITGMSEEFLRRLRKAADDSSDKAGRGGGEDLHIIQHIPTVRINRLAGSRDE